MRKLAKLLDRLLNAITGSSYGDTWKFTPKIIDYSESDQSSYYAEAIWSIVENDFRIRCAGYVAMTISGQPDDWDISAAERLEDDPLYQTLAEIENLFLADAQPAKRNLDKGTTAAWKDIISKIDRPDAAVSVKVLAMSFVGLFEKFHKAVRWLLLKVAKLADPVWWDHSENLLQFFFTLLKSERAVLSELKNSYGDNRPKRFYVHYLMDMEKAYDPPDKPHYPFYPEQLRRMQHLANDTSGQLIGFAAFDPRRKNWKQIADEALRLGFVGFKFYPPMGYRPASNENDVIEQRVSDFFRYCIRKQIPIFAHCTPTGFEHKTASERMRTLNIGANV